MKNQNNGDLPDDELKDVQQPSTTSNPSAAKANDPAVGDAATTQSSNVQSWNMDTDDDVAAQVLRRSGIEYVKASENSPARIAFIPGCKAVGGQAHYDSGDKRYYICGSRKGNLAPCCKKLGDPKGRCAAFVFRYTNADGKTAKLDQNVQPEVEVQILTMSNSNYQDAKNCIEEGGSIYDVDFKISVAEKQLQRKVNVISRSARWKQVEKQALEMAAPIIADERQLKRALGKEFGDGDSKASLGDIEEM
ncbi:MAG: hypothetical protein ABR881_32070 [Candidatus Sulfotelmatobacter sp.]|jgi:hypothetical protein